MANPKRALTILVVLLIPSWILYGIEKEARHATAQRCPAIQPHAALAESAPSPVHVGAQLPAAPASGKTVRMKVTAYCICAVCCEGWSKFARTATGDDARIYDGVAADPKRLPYRTRLEIPEIGIKEVDDTGGGMRKSAREGVTHIDVRMPSHSQARQWGVRWLNVKVLGKS